MLSRAYDYPSQAKFAKSSIVFDETGAVVATALASANTDYDNGAFLHGSDRS